MLTATEKLERLRNYGTRYEVVLQSPDGCRYLVQYTSQTSRMGLLHAIRKVGEHVVRVAGLGDNDRLTFSGKGRMGHVADLGNGWTARYSGRTQRDAICSGELEFIAGIT